MLGRKLHTISFNKQVSEVRVESNPFGGSWFLSLAPGNKFPVCVWDLLP